MNARALNTQHYQIVIVGGGSAGISVAARLTRALKRPDIAIIITISPSGHSSAAVFSPKNVRGALRRTIFRVGQRGSRSASSNSAPMRTKSSPIADVPLNMTIWSSQPVFRSTGARLRAWKVISVRMVSVATTPMSNVKVPGERSKTFPAVRPSSLNPVVPLNTAARPRKLCI